MQVVALYDHVEPLPNMRVDIRVEGFQAREPCSDCVVHQLAVARHGSPGFRVRVIVATAETLGPLAGERLELRV